MECVSLLVMSCDKYSDCWEPYIHFLNKFWSECDYTTVLCTEKEQSPLFQQVVLCDTPKWSNRLLQACTELKTEFVLFTLDDFWLSAPLPSAKFSTYLQYMHKNADVGVIYLNSQITAKSLLDIDLQEIAIGTPYRINAGPALWRTSFLKAVLQEGESAWDFERIGSFRATTYEKRVLRTLDTVWTCVCITGAIEQGKWERTLKSFLQQENINIDLSQRKTKSLMDCFWKKIKNIIYNLNPIMILKIQNFLFYQKNRKKKVY